MGGGSTQSGQQAGSSNSTSNFQSNPLNVSNPPLYGLGQFLANALSNITGNFGGPGSGGGTTNANADSVISPTLQRDAGGNYYQTNNTAANPLVAGMTGQQQGLVNQLGPMANPASNPNAANAGNNAAGLSYVASSPYAASPGFAGATQSAQNALGTSANSGNFGGGFAGQAGQFAGNSGNFGGGTAGQAAGFAGNPNNFGGGLAGAGGAVGAGILPNAANPLAAGTNTALGGQYGGASANQAMNTAQTLGFGTGLASQAGQFAGAHQNLAPAGQVLRNEMAPDFASRFAVNPFTAGLVGAAEAPILNSFNTQTIPGLQGTFTAAGQRLGSAGTGVGGSSAFDVAGANALTGLGANLGATAASIYNPLYQQGAQIGANAPGQFAALQGQKLAGLESAATTKAQTDAQKVQSLDQAALARLQVTTGKSQQELAAAALAGNLTAQESAALTAASGAATAAGGTQAGALTSASGAQTAAGSAQTAGLTGAAGALTQAGVGQTGAQATAAGANLGVSQNFTDTLAKAAQTSQGISTAQINDTINSLNASALPQMTTQYGINQGMQLYQTQMQQLMTLLGLGVQGAQPTIANQSSGGGVSTAQSSGSSSGFGANLSPLLLFG